MFINDFFGDTKKGVAEATGDPKFDKMIKGITGKRQVAKQQRADTKQQASDAFSGMFGGGNPADKLGIRKKGMAEGADDIAQAKERLAYLEKIFDTSYEYSDDHSVWKKHNAIRQEMDQLKKIISQGVNEDEGDSEGLPHLTKELLTHIVQQVGAEGAHAIIKSLEWGDGAADELLQLIVNDLEDDIDGDLDETYGAQLHTKHKKNRFKQIKKIKSQKKPFGLKDLDEAGCNMTEEGQACPVHGIQECPGYEMLETSPQDKLHQHHQEIRKKSGLPHPDHYLKMMKQKQAEIDALKAEIAADKAKGIGEGLRDPKDNPCWKGYKPVGTKKKAGKTVPNCVPTNEDIESYVEALGRAGYELQEEKTRLDPKCWKGKKIGNPKTKMKGGVRVNNCVPK